MKYLCLVYHDTGTNLDAISDEEFDSMIGEVKHYLEKLDEAGHLVSASPLQPAESAVTLRVHRGSVTLTDGPFIETKEQLAGYYLLEARDQNEAVRLASNTPSARHGTIEIRPLKTLSFRGETGAATDGQA